MNKSLQAFGYVFTAYLIVGTLHTLYQRYFGRPSSNNGDE